MVWVIELVWWHVITQTSHKNAFVKSNCWTQRPIISERYSQSATQDVSHLVDTMLLKLNVIFICSRFTYLRHVHAIITDSSCYKLWPCLTYEKWQLPVRVSICPVHIVYVAWFCFLRVNESRQSWLLRHLKPQRVKHSKCIHAMHSQPLPFPNDYTPGLLPIWQLPHQG